MRGEKIIKLKRSPTAIGSIMMTFFSFEPNHPDRVEKFLPVSPMMMYLKR
jgi:hypothetical protein